MAMNNSRLVDVAETVRESPGLRNSVKDLSDPVVSLRRGRQILSVTSVIRGTIENVYYPMSLREM